MLSRENKIFILELFNLKKRGNEIEIRIGTFTNNFNPNLTQVQYDVLLDKLNVLNKKFTVERSVVFTNDSGLRKVIILKEDNKPKLSYTEQKTQIKIYDMPNLGIRLALSNETKINTTNKNQYNLLRYRDRKSIISDDKNWSYDITKVITRKLGNLSQAAEIIKEIIKPIDPEAEENVLCDYNIEIELINDKITEDEFMESLEAQLNIIKSSVDVKKNSLTHIIYTKMYNLIKEERWKNYTFRDFISQPITMQLKDLGTIETNEYAATEKADGQRHLLFIDEAGKAYLINNSDTITPLNLAGKFKNAIVDGELINLKTFAAFDIIVHDDIDISKKDLRYRFSKLKELIKLIDASNAHVSITFKEQRMVESAQFNDIYKLNDTILETKFPYKTDGLILTPINESYYNSATFKWKPTHETTIDFLIKRIKVHKNTIEYHLYVGITRGDFNLHNFRHDKEYPLMFPKINLETALYFPTLFKPPENQNLYIACLPRKLDLPDDIIVELYYDTEEPEAPEGTSAISPWKFRNIREDKTAEYKKYNNNFGNTWKTAYTNLTAILRPITEEIIRGRSKAPFFLPDANKDNAIIGMRKFHNHIKALIYADYVKNKKWLLEIAAGRLADLNRWVINDIKNIVALDVDVQAIEEGARRIESKKQTVPADKFPNIYLGVADALNEWSGYIRETVQLDVNPKFDVIAIQFALHFFLQSDATLAALISNISSNLNKNGLFIATALDGMAVNKLLNANNIKTGETLSLKKMCNGKNKTVIGIKKEYGTEASTSNEGIANVGNEISVYIDSIGTFHKEYLINFEYLKNAFEKAKFKLVDFKGFNDFYNAKKYPMSESELLYSFMNRVIIFKKMK